MKSTGQNTAFSANKTLNVQGRLINLTEPVVMGILNATPDSFYDGGRYRDEANLLKQAEKMLIEGATFIDVGGYSSRPGAEDISLQTERERTISAIRTIRSHFKEACITVDTFRSEVAKAAVNEGACMINDISGGELDPDMHTTVAALKVPYIIMHMRGTPQTMHHETAYDNLIGEITDYFHAKIHALHQWGVKDIILDPGFGFAKTIEQNFTLLHSLEYFRVFEKPMLVGLSRKSMVWKTLHTTPEEALNGTTVLHTVALLKGAAILRAHDVKEAMEVVTLIRQLQAKPAKSS